MRRSVLTFGLVGIVLLVLVALNVAFMSQPHETENERTGDRSSYRTSAFGLSAFATLLAERGYTVERLEKPFTSLAGSSIQTLFVVVPKAELQPTTEELDALDEWVVAGGNLVIVDREILLDVKLGTFSTGALVDGAVVPSAASPYARGIRELTVTEFATTLVDATETSIVDLAARNGSVLIDRPHGQGHVSLLTEPYLLQNNGIREKDNLALALNLADGMRRGGRIAFDEYHHGYGHASVGDSDGGLRAYIANTPVPWAIAQIGLLALVIAVTAGARFGRAVPVVSARRTTALEFVASMANIQRLAHASDLAIENVYSSFRARLCRYANVPSDTPPEDLARAASARGQIDPNRLFSVIDRCEKTLRDRMQPTAPELLAIVQELRAVEAELHL